MQAELGKASSDAKVRTACPAELRATASTVAGFDRQKASLPGSLVVVEAVLLGLG